jgi:hypothetical protein
MVLLFFALRRRVGVTALRRILPSALRTLGAAAAAALGARALLAVVPRLGGGGALGSMIPGVVAAVLFGALFVVAARLFGSPELAVLTSGLRRRLARTKRA